MEIHGHNARSDANMHADATTEPWTGPKEPSEVGERKQRVLAYSVHKPNTTRDGDWKSSNPCGSNVIVQFLLSKAKGCKDRTNHCTLPPKYSCAGLRWELRDICCATVVPPIHINNFTSCNCQLEMYNSAKRWRKRETTSCTK